MPNRSIPGRAALTLVLIILAVTACGGTAMPGSGPDAAAERDSDGNADAGDAGDDSDDSDDAERADESAQDVGDDARGGGAQSAQDVLSPCAPAGSAATTLLVAPTGQRPPPDEMEEALADNPDAQFMIDDLTAGGMSRDAAVHTMYAQVVGADLLEAARALPGFVTGAYARPEAGEPFQLAFSGEEVPDAFDPSAFPLGSYGLEVTTGATGYDEAGFDRAFDAAVEAGLRVLGGWGDQATGTATIEVISATPEQVAAWEEAVGEAAATICLVQVEPTEGCDEEVVADARGRADREADPVPADAPEDQDPTVVAGHVGLTLEESQARAGDERRAWRVVVEDGVGLPVTMDLVPGRLDVTVCRGVVVDAYVER